MEIISIKTFSLFFFIRVISSYLCDPWFSPTWNREEQILRTGRAARRLTLAGGAAAGLW
jgi:hypothetical protein